MFDIGIIGGMGPAATAELFRRIVIYTYAHTDQEHIKMCILNDPTIPDRTNYILGKGDSPLPAILHNVETAKEVGCKYFAIPCNTSHFFYSELENVSGIEFINMVLETCKYGMEVFPAKKICVLGTLGTIEGDIYRKIGGIEANIVYPSEKSAEVLMNTIRCIKAGTHNLKELAAAVSQTLAEEFSKNKTVFILACTELSLLLPYLNNYYYIDAMDVLAGTIITKCQKKLDPDTFKLRGDFFCK